MDRGGRRVDRRQVGQVTDLSMLVLDDQLLHTLLAVDMEALEQFWVFEDIKADGTG